MADKINTTIISSGFASTAALNENFDKISDELNNKVLYRDTLEPNQMENDLDMNSQRIINLPPPLNGTDPARWEDVRDGVNTIGVALPSFSQTGARYLASDGTGLVFRSPSRLNVAAMTAILKADLLSGDVIFLDNRAAQGDKGGGAFFFDPLSVATTSLGRVFATDEGGDGRWIRILEGRVTAEMFGTTGDGITDDTLSIQAALDDVGNISIGKGTPLTDGILLNSFGNSINGESQYDTIITANSINTTLLSTNNFSGNQVKRMRLDGDGLAGTKGLSVDNTFYSVFENVDIRGTLGNAIGLINSNNNTFSALQVHNVSGDGLVIDATSQHNTFNGSGSEDFSGIGISCNGIGNVFNAPWVENRASATAATDTGIRINNRDNILTAPEIRGAPGFELGVGIELGSSSTDTILTNPHIADATIPIKLTGVTQYRSIFGVPLADITNVNSDTTTYIRRGNEVYSNQKWISPAPDLTYESTNGTSGIRFNLVGLATSSHMRWQINGVTILELDSSDNLLPGSDGVQSLGASTKRFLNGNFSGYISVGDGVSTPGTVSGSAFIYVDSADGDLKIKFGDGTIKTITVDT